MDSCRSYADRVANLTNGTGPQPRLNGGNYLKQGATVFDDPQEDKLTGAAGQDWFFVDSKDKITDKKANERLNSRRL